MLLEHVVHQEARRLRSPSWALPRHGRSVCAAFDRGRYRPTRQSFSLQQALRHAHQKSLKGLAIESSIRRHFCAGIERKQTAEFSLFASRIDATQTFVHHDFCLLFYDYYWCRKALCHVGQAAQDDSGMWVFRSQYLSLYMLQYLLYFMSWFYVLAHVYVLASVPASSSATVSAT